LGRVLLVSASLVETHTTLSKALAEYPPPTYVVCCRFGLGFLLVYMSTRQKSFFDQNTNPKVCSFSSYKLLTANTVTDKIPSMETQAR
jgi:hypothetical protein